MNYLKSKVVIKQQPQMSAYVFILHFGKSSHAFVAGSKTVATTNGLNAK